jgi:hypothetical protein
MITTTTIVTTITTTTSITITTITITDHVYPETPDNLLTPETEKADQAF